ncbi:MAG: tetratricopeptide repeat protein [Rhizobiaceae bacterium]|nr:tetratricopeptide repeat protein [Rhizobiaceae bacterium]MCV0405043.1 tetratricopeptide repeat protein [Rhizobiaceae bacterium]
MASSRFSSRSLLTVALLGAAVAVSGCANKQLTTGSINRSGGEPISQMSSGELGAATERLGQAYAKDPKNIPAAMSYASALGMSGRNDQALAVMRKLTIDHPKERQVLSAYGKALASVGEFEPALDAVRRAQTPEYPDWKLVSAEGAILDQMGERDQARVLFRKALDLRPNEPSILSNLGMSYLLEGDLKTAEIHMRKASEQPGADSRVRQNLALVVGLQGRFEEAERIASAELSPDQAQANVQYLRQMLSQQNAWQQLSDEEKENNTN